VETFTILLLLFIVVFENFNFVKKKKMENGLLDDELDDIIEKSSSKVKVL
jgi:hypothetical protein